MPAFLENKLKREYPNNPGAVYGTLNAIGAMRGSKETAKGRAMQAKHDRDAQNPTPRTRQMRRPRAAPRAGASACRAASSRPSARSPA